MLPSESANPQVTILTPTWNRRHLLPVLYQSIATQDAPPGHFEWLVVDDGSSDGTADWIETLIPEAPFPIRLIRQENGGKHRALNRAAMELLSPWVLIVDSDDWLLPGAMQGILDDTSSAKSDVLAIIAPRQFEGLPPCWFRLPGRTVTFAEWRVQRQVGDTSIIMRSELLRQHPFPEFEGEKFVAESSSFSRMFRNGGIWLSNSTNTGGEYLDGGLSSQSLRLRATNPIGTVFTYREHIRSELRWRQWIRSTINYHRFFWYAHHHRKTIASLGFRANPLWLLPGWVLHVRDRRKLKNDK